MDLKNIKEEILRIGNKYEKLTGDGNGYKTFSGFQMDIFERDILEKNPKFLYKKLYDDEKDKFVPIYLIETSIISFSEAFKALYPKTKKLSKKEKKKVTRILNYEISNCLGTNYGAWGDYFEKEILSIINEPINKVFKVNEESLQYLNLEYVCINTLFFIYTESYSIIIYSGFSD